MPVIEFEERIVARCVERKVSGVGEGRARIVCVSYVCTLVLRISKLGYLR